MKPCSWAPPELRSPGNPCSKDPGRRTDCSAPRVCRCSPQPGGRKSSARLAGSWPSSIRGRRRADKPPRDGPSRPDAGKLPGRRTDCTGRGRAAVGRHPKRRDQTASREGRPRRGGSWAEGRQQLLPRTMRSCLAAIRRICCRSLQGS